jgi:GABA permease
LGDQRPLRALARASITTLPPEHAVWYRLEVVDRARAEHGVPVTHVVATPVGVAHTTR